MYYFKDFINRTCKLYIQKFNITCRIYNKSIKGRVGINCEAIVVPVDAVGPMVAMGPMGWVVSRGFPGDFS